MNAAVVLRGDRIGLAGAALSFLWGRQLWCSLEVPFRLHPRLSIGRALQIHRPAESHKVE